MPELPEVEFARGLACRACRGKVITEVIAEDDNKVFENKNAADGPASFSPAEIASALTGRTVLAVLRKGKYFWFDLSGDGPQILFHFGMAGHLAVQGVAGATYIRIKHTEGPWPPKYTKLQLVFDDGTKLAFADSRRFARIKLQKKIEEELPVSKLGPDAHLELPDVDGFRALMAKHKRSVKAVLLDQEVMAGIGNYLGDEVLYQAAIFPERPCCDLLKAEVDRLHKSIRDVVTLAVNVGADYKQFPPEWLFHFRWTAKKATKDFYGNSVAFITVGGRTTAYAPALQKLSTAARANPAVSKAAKAAAADAAEDGDAVIEGATAAKAGKKKAAKKPAKAAAAAADGAAEGAAGDGEPRKGKAASKKRKASATDGDGDGGAAADKDDAPSAVAAKAKAKPRRAGVKRKGAAVDADDEDGDQNGGGAPEAAKPKRGSAAADTKQNVKTPKRPSGRGGGKAAPGEVKEEPSADAPGESEPVAASSKRRKPAVVGNKKGGATAVAAAKATAAAGKAKSGADVVEVAAATVVEARAAATAAGRRVLRVTAARLASSQGEAGRTGS